MKAFISALLVSVLVGCGAPLRTATPPASPALTTAPSPTASPSPSPRPTIAFTCYQDPVPSVGSPVWLPSSYCPAEEAGVEAAVAPLGHTISSMTITQRPMPCGPFPSGDARFCALALTLPWAFVTFADTDMVAALTLTLVAEGPIVATLVALQVPPPGWSIR